jgi:glycine/sarcosine N-methyltransferase
METYDPLAAYYEEIFPTERARVDFIDSCVRSKIRKRSGKVRLLDIGCATGELAEALTHRGYLVEGIDLNEEMVRRAKRRPSIRARVMDT